MRNKMDLNSAKQGLKDKLSAIILLETAKSYEEIDCGLVDECVDFLMELEGKERLSKKEIEQRVKNIPFKGKVTAIGSYTNKKIRAKRLAVIAAVLTMIIALLSIISLASEDSFGNLFYKMGHNLIELLDDKTVEYDGVTISKNNETRAYGTVEELFEAENLNVMYPSWLPENIEILTIQHINNYQNKYYSINCDNPTYSILIYCDKMIEEELKQNCLSEEINGYEVYYFTLDNYIQGSFTYKNNQYVLAANTKEELFKIIENLKEIN